MGGRLSINGSLLILKPPLHSFWAETDKMAQLAIRQALLAERGDMADAASCVSRYVVNGPEGCGRR